MAELFSEFWGFPALENASSLGVKHVTFGMASMAS